MNSFETQQLARELKTTPEQRMQWLTKAFRLARASLSCWKTRGKVSLENSHVSPFQKGGNMGRSRGENGVSRHL